MAESDSPIHSSPSTLQEDIIPPNVTANFQYFGQVNNNSADPFYIHPAENHNVVTPVLTDDNYASWSDNMEKALSVKAKSGFVDGYIPEPTDAAQIIFWKRANNLVTSSFVMNYYTRLRALWDGIDDIRPTQVCVCGHDSDILKNMNQHRVMEFLQRLHDHFTALCSSILQCDIFPPIISISNLVYQEEGQQDLNNIINPTIASTALTVTRHGHTNIRSAKKRNYYLCDHCQMGGHYIEHCHKLQGYPST
ncbi:uncharacterized protein LOC141685134 [Apium graveolens]|uniref:uncharacterized protein LOC141685134 n=1 Tax=Apium graveolens TaxID=4045 RepID=UPI003D7B11FE